MTRRAKLWQAAAALFTLVNVAGAGFAVAMGELRHAGVHLVLMGVGITGYQVWRLASGKDPLAAPRAQIADDRLEYLQQSVDAIALEVERIGEAQRFSEKLRAQQGEVKPLTKPPTEA